jgi:transglutaminase-like putative cysteine protease
VRTGNLSRLWTVAAVLAVVFTACKNRPPYITEVSPKFASEGDVIQISGEHFGEAGERAYVTIAGERPTASSYILWQDDTIKVRIARSGLSGLIYVFADGKQSNGVMFSDRDAIPLISVKDMVKAGPILNELNPKTVFPGDLLTITGSGFGAYREQTGVFFTWNIGGQPARHGLPASVFEGGYESWGEREIRVYVPDGASTGILTVANRDDNYRPDENAAPVAPGSHINLEVSPARGRKTLRDSREYIVVLSADVAVQEASTPNTLYLALPRPVPGASQQITRVLSRTMEPFAEDHRGTTLYRISDIKTGETVQITVSYLVTVCTVETAIAQAATVPNTRLPVYKTYLGKTPLIPAEHPEIVAKAASITGRERNPYLKAQLIYRTLQNDLTINTNAGTDGALEALDSKTADSYSASLLFTALCRATGIPAAPYSGILVNTDRSTIKHHWAAFWIDGIGWIPVDIALGAGAAPENWTLHTSHTTWYFGNIDNQRIAFSFGERVLTPIDPKGRTVSRNREYALQNIWEEASGGLESYSSLWSDISVNGIYFH